MTNLQLLAEVRRFFPHARTDGRDVSCATRARAAERRCLLPCRPAGAQSVPRWTRRRTARQATVWRALR